MAIFLGNREDISCLSENVFLLWLYSSTEQFIFQLFCANIHYFVYFNKFLCAFSCFFLVIRRKRFSRNDNITLFRVSASIKSKRKSDFFNQISAYVLYLYIFVGYIIYITPVTSTRRPYHCRPLQHNQCQGGSDSIR